MNERTFAGDAERLLSPQRLEMLETERVADFCLEGVSSALDVGTGVGLFAGVFQSRGVATLAGVDIRPELLSLARQRIPAADFQEADAGKLPFTDGQFDLVFLGHLLHEVDDPAAVLREAARVARRRVAVLEWPHRQEEKGPPLDHRMTEEQVILAAVDAGLGETRVEPLTWMVLYIWDTST